MDNVITVIAQHTMIDSHTGSVRRGFVVPRALIPKSPDECGGLQNTVRLAVGCRILLRRNVHTEDGLANGAIGTVRGFRWTGTESTTVAPQPARNPTAVFVEFDDARTGSLWRLQYGMAAGTGPVAIEQVSARFTPATGGMTGLSQIVRSQFPLDLTYAMTIHRVQGMSLDRAVIDLGTGIISDGQAYVALSRVRTLEGVAICS